MNQDEFNSLQARRSGGLHRFYNYPVPEYKELHVQKLNKKNDTEKSFIKEIASHAPNNCKVRSIYRMKIRDDMHNEVVSQFHRSGKNSRNLCIQ